MASTLLRAIAAEAAWTPVAQGSRQLRLLARPAGTLAAYPGVQPGARRSPAAAFRTVQMPRRAGTLQRRPAAGIELRFHSWRAASSAVASSAASGTVSEEGCASCPTAIPKLSECWNCQERHGDAGCSGTMFCGGCGAMQPPDDTVSYFTLLEVPEERFDINTTALEGQYKSMIRELHPDRHMDKSRTEQGFSTVSHWRSLSLQVPHLESATYSALPACAQAR